MVVVKDEDELLAHGRDLVQEHGQERLGGRRLGGFERSQHPCSDTGRDGLQGCHEVSQKAGGVVIPCVQRQPGNPICDFGLLIYDFTFFSRIQSKIVTRKS